jgi:hypothetical protein
VRSGSAAFRQYGYREFAADLGVRFFCQNMDVRPIPHKSGVTIFKDIPALIRVFLSAYGFAQNDDLFDWMQLRLKTEIDLFVSGTTDDPIRRQKKIEAGHLDLYKRDLHLITGISGFLRKFL